MVMRLMASGNVARKQSQLIGFRLKQVRHRAYRRLFQIKKRGGDTPIYSRTSALTMGKKESAVRRSLHPGHA